MKAISRHCSTLGERMRLCHPIDVAVGIKYLSALPCQDDFREYDGGHNDVVVADTVASAGSKFLLGSPIRMDLETTIEISKLCKPSETIRI